MIYLICMTCRRSVCPVLSGESHVILYNQHDLGRVSWVGYVMPTGLCPTYHNGSWGSRWSICRWSIWSIWSVWAVDYLSPWGPSLLISPFIDVASTLPGDVSDTKYHLTYICHVASRNENTPKENLRIRLETYSKSADERGASPWVGGKIRVLFSYIFIYLLTSDNVQWHDEL